MVNYKMSINLSLSSLVVFINKNNEKTILFKYEK